MQNTEQKPKPKPTPEFVRTASMTARALPLITFATTKTEVWFFGVANVLGVAGVVVLVGLSGNPLASALGVLLAYLAMAWVCEAHGRAMYTRGIREGFMSTMRGAAAMAAEELAQHETDCPECALAAKLNKH